MSTMTLEKIRDALRDNDDVVCHANLRLVPSLDELADAIDAHLAAREAEGDAHAPVALALGVDEYAQLVCKPLEAWSSLPEDWDGSLYAHPATQQAAEPVEKAKPEQAVGDGVDGWDVAERVRLALDRASCPDAFMRIAFEAVVGAFHETTPRPAVEVTEPRYIATGHGASDEVHRAANLLEKIPARHASDRAIMETAISYLRAHASSLAAHPHTGYSAVPERITPYEAKRRGWLSGPKSFAAGWNACCDAMLAAAPEVPKP